MSKDLSPSLEIGVTQAILGLSGKSLSRKEILKKCFIVENASLKTALTTFDEISSYVDYLLDFKEENSLCNSSSAISCISKTGPLCSKKFC